VELTPGTRLGPYEVLAPLGSGGMGEVYAARDTRLDRRVAIKVSKAQFSERFEREARAVAALNHPHICQLYDVGPNYLVMELVEGTPVGPVADVRQLLELATQIADGLAAAHAVGIVHRDIKPSNLLVTASGQVKILDFGLATVMPTSTAASDVTRDQFHRLERQYGAFRRSFTLPTTVDASKVDANYQDGVLTVKLPRREDSKPKQIQING